MRLFVIVILSGLFIDTACAQQQQSLLEQALSTKLSQEINTSLVCSVSALSVQRDLDAAKARIKELEAQVAK